MQKNVLATRLGPEEAKAVAFLAKLEGLEKSALLRKLVKTGLKAYRESLAVKAYGEGKASLRSACEIAALNAPEMLALLENHGVRLNYDAAELRKDLEQF